MIYLISWDDVEQIRKSTKYSLEIWDNFNLDYSMGGWIAHDTLSRIREIGFDPPILAEVDDLPVFFGPLETPYEEHYKSALTAICLSRPDGSTIRGVSYLLPYDDYWLCQDLGRCFRYGYRDEPQHYWRMISHFGDAEWLIGYWGNEHGFLEWLASVDLFQRKDL